VKIVIDACAWIEHFIGSGKGQKVKEIVENADEVYTPDTVLAEIARKYMREDVEEEIIDSRLQEITGASNIIHVDIKLALEAARCFLELSAKARKSKQKDPNLFDAIVLAAGRLFESRIMTGDEHFRSLTETIWIG
jgi:predicted nucleic acid-binding protein